MHIILVYIDETKDNVDILNITCLEMAARLTVF